MAHDQDNSRPSSQVPCIYWSGTVCTATRHFTQESISCYHDGNCDGFGTCRGCNKYDQGGMKFGQVDGLGGKTQTPMNLAVYNVRAKVATCCFWDGEPDDFGKTSAGSLFPIYRPVDSSVSSSTPDNAAASAPGEPRDTKCVLSEASPWQIAFTEQNPTNYGCNGAKPECPFYTGPKFTEVVDSKMDTGNRITAKQIMELRFYSDVWSNYANPRAEWEARFEQPDIWAWARDESRDGEVLPGAGRYDDFGRPLLQKVYISNLSAKQPEFVVDPPVPATEGTPTVGQPPNFPDLIRQLYSLPTGMEVLWPRGTTVSNPFVRKTFTKEERNIWISVQLNSQRSAYAVNLTKQSQSGRTDRDFINYLRINHPEDLIPAISSGFPASTFAVPLVFNGNKERLNQIRIFLDSDSDDGSLPHADVYINHIFYHAHVAQTSFSDYYGHQAIDPWVNHFSNINIGAEFLHLTGNTSVNEVLLNTITSNGKKTMYAVEESVVASSSGESPTLSWEPIGCNYIAVTFLDTNVNRVYPWKSWGNDTNGEPLYVTVDRTSNTELPTDESTIVTMELAFASTKGTAIPAHIAIFKPVSNESITPFDVSKDIVRARYVYTVYKHGPLQNSDIPNLKFKEDVNKVITQLVYDVFHTQDTLDVTGTFVKAGDRRIYSCEQVLGDCYDEVALENEGRAQTVFFAGGVDEGTLLSHGSIITRCKERFEAGISGTFDDGTPVTYVGVVNRLSGIHMWEGEQRYFVSFSDEEGRPIGSKSPVFLLQSSISQTRDVEIKYKWGGSLQHYPTRDGMILLAIFHRPIYATQGNLLRLIQEYTPRCGDHAETTTANPQFRAFDISIDGSGPLWYPYKRCTQPRYHADSSVFTNVVEYNDVVEGFEEGKRPFYWERMRFFDKYMPAVISFINQIGCFWSERTTTVNVNPPVTFTGYTKIRSSHPFGAYASDRESVRISRHWRKRNLAVREETIIQEDGGYSIKLTDDFTELLLDPETLELRSGDETQTPIWVHINDGLSVVLPASEAEEHPFTHLLLQRSGSFVFNEQFFNDRVTVSQAFVERDYTSNLVRNEDGSKIYLADGTELNVQSGYEDVFAEEQDGSDVRWVFREPTTGWAWMAEPQDPTRGTPRITGLFISNPGRVLFKSNREPATHTTEGLHTVLYRPHKFAADGALVEGARLTLDGGPELYISQTDGQVFILEESGSPYDPAEHIEGDYQFVMHGNGPNGVGILADNRGLQRYELGGTKYATFAGVNINVVFDIDELPYEERDIREIGRLSGVSDPETGDSNPDETQKIVDAIREYTVDEISVISLNIDFHGHYYVERVSISFEYGVSLDIPAVSIQGQLKESGAGNVDDAEAAVYLVEPTTYQRGDNKDAVEEKVETFNIKQRLFNLDINIGARLSGRAMNITNIQVVVRENVVRSEQISVFEPRVQLSSCEVGTHKPSDLEFYFQRSYPDFAKDYLSGQLSIGQLTAGQGITAIPGTEIKYLGRQIKDIIPQFEFSDVVNNRFPYNNIDLSVIPGYTEQNDSAGTVRYVEGPITACSKGWAMYTSKHYSDPGPSMIATDTGPLAIENVLDGNQPVEELQELLYTEAGRLGGDKISVYNSFWHPSELEFFSNSGVDLNEFSWTLTLYSAVAPINRVFRHEDYGCLPQVTTENLDGAVHRVSNWQARGVFHYLCDPRYSWACLTSVMNKCNKFLFDEYGTPSYLDDNVVDRFTYVFSFPPRDYQSYFAAGLINHNEIGGIIGGTGAVGSAVAASAPVPNHNQLVQQYTTSQPPKGPGPYQ